MMLIFNCPECGQKYRADENCQCDFSPDPEDTELFFEDSPYPADFNLYDDINSYGE